jgi:hypothetical protein
MTWFIEKWFTIMHFGTVAVPYVSVLLVVALIWGLFAPKAYDKVACSIIITLVCILWVCHAMSDGLRRYIEVNYNATKLEQINLKINKLLEGE